MTKISCVIPAYNEAESLPRLWEALAPVITSRPGSELILISDGSTDATVAVVRQLADAGAPIRLVRFHRNRGKAAALMAGFALAQNEIVVTLDADLQDVPDEIPRLIEPIERNEVDLVVGWKKTRRDPLGRRLSSKLFNGLANRFVGTSFHDMNCGLKAMRRDVLSSLDLYGDLYRFIPVLAAAAGWRTTELPVEHRPRAFGRSRYGLRLGGIFDLITLLMITRYRWRPLHFFGRWGAFFFLIGFVMLAYLTVLRLQGQAIGDRPLLIFGVLFVLTGLQLFFTGLLGDFILRGQSRHADNQSTEVR